jgi:hypothetical protein
VVDHQRAGMHLRIGTRDGELHAHVLTVGPAKQAAFLCMFGRLGDEPIGIADALSGHQDAR